MNSPKLTVISLSLSYAQTRTTLQEVRLNVCIYLYPTFHPNETLSSLHDFPLPPLLSLWKPYELGWDKGNGPKVPSQLL